MNIRSILLLLLLATFGFAVPAHGQSQGEVLVDTQEIVKARVIEILGEEQRQVAGTNFDGVYQKIVVEILEGKQKGKNVTLENDYLKLNNGEVFYLLHTISAENGTDYYAIDEPYRLPQIIVLTVIFVVAIFFFGGIQGVRGLVSLIGSLLLILYVLLPGILHGYSPLLITTLVSALIIIVGSYVTHGFNRTTSSAVIGMIVTVIITGLLAVWAVSFARLSGFGSEEVTYLNLNTHGQIDIVGLLLGGIMIGLLGVLYDVAIGQAVSVEELIRIAPHAPKKLVYKRAIRIGREHIGALVNTLAIAYVGVSLPLLLLFYISETTNVASMINREIFATEIIRTLIGSIGLILAVPVTTLVAMWMLSRHMKGDTKSENGANDPDQLRAEIEALEHAHAGAGHVH